MRGLRFRPGSRRARSGHAYSACSNTGRYCSQPGPGRVLKSITSGPILVERTPCRSHVPSGSKGRLYQDCRS